MTFPKIFETILLLVLYYFFLSLIVSLVSQSIMASAQTRGWVLRTYLEKIAGDKTQELLNLPEIRSLRPIRFKSWFSVFGARTEAKMVENIPLPILVDAYFRTMGFSSKKRMTQNQIFNVIEDMPETEAKQAFRNWFQEGITKINELKEKASIYFSGLINQSQELATAQYRSMVIVFSIVLVIALGVDTIQLVKSLSVDTQLRNNVLMAQINATLEKNGPNADLSAFYEQANNIWVPIGWWQSNDFPSQSSATISDWIMYLLIKIDGLAITAVAVSPGVSFWFDVFQKLRK